MKTQTAIKQAMSAYFSIIHYIIYVGKTDTPHKSATQRPRFPPIRKREGTTVSLSERPYFSFCWIAALSASYPGLLSKANIFFL